MTEAPQGTPTPTTPTPEGTMTAPRHASSTTTPYRVGAHYLTPETQGYPLILLADAVALGDTVATDTGLPVGVGLTPRDGALDDGPCPVCGTACWVWVQDGDDDGPGEVECLLCLCLTVGTSYGVVPAMAVEWVGVE